MIGLGGNVTVDLRDRNSGVLVQARRARNHVTASGRDAIRNLICGRGLPPRSIALGFGATAVSDTDTALGSEKHRQPFTRIRVAGSRITFELFVDADEANDYGISGSPFTELGLFAGTKFIQDETYEGIRQRDGGSLIARTVINTLTKTEDSTLTVLWDFDIATESPITNAGREWIRDCICGAGGGITHCALGTGATAPALTDVALEAEGFRNGITRTVLQPSKAQFEMWLATDQGNGSTYAEVGLFASECVPYTTAAAGLTTGGGTCIARAALSPTIAKTSAAAVPFIFELPITSDD